MLINQRRHLRTLEPGEVVYRKMPMKARPPKHLLGPPSSGPYEVVSQRTPNSAKLRDLATKELVDGGNDIPMEHILLAPRRSQVRWERAEDSKRSIGEMMREERGREVPEGVAMSGWKQPNQKVGWGEPDQRPHRGIPIVFRKRTFCSRSVAEFACR